MKKIIALNTESGFPSFTMTFKELRGKSSPDNDGFIGLTRSPIRDRTIAKVNEARQRLAQQDQAVPVKEIKPLEYKTKKGSQVGGAIKSVLGKIALATIYGGTFIFGMLGIGANPLFFIPAVLLLLVIIYIKMPYGFHVIP